MKNNERQEQFTAEYEAWLAERESELERQISDIKDALAKSEAELEDYRHFRMLAEKLKPIHKPNTPAPHNETSTPLERTVMKPTIFLQVLKEEYGGKAKAAELKESLKRYPEFQGVDQVRSNVFDRMVGTLKDQGKIASVKFNKVNILTWWVIRDGIDISSGKPRLKHDYFPTHPKITTGTPYEVNHNMG